MTHLPAWISNQTQLHSICPTLCAAAVVLTLASTPGSAQQGRPDLGPSVSVTAAALGSGESDLGDDDTIQWSRAAIGVQTQLTTRSRLSYGAAMLVGRTSYRFDSGAFGEERRDVNEFTLSAPLSFPVGEMGRVFISPNLSYHGEAGVAFEDGVSYGLLAGIGWRVSPTLFIGPGLGVASSLIEGEDATVFPFVVLNWEVAEGWALSTGGGFGATRGPGLRLAFQPDNDWEFGFEVRREEFEFALDDSDSERAEVGRDRHVPVLLTARYAPTETVSVSGFVGAAVGGNFAVFDADGDEIYEEDFETTPLLGFAATFRF